jgi:hypothetical protein
MTEYLKGCPLTIKEEEERKEKERTRTSIKRNQETVGCGVSPRFGRGILQAVEKMYHDHRQSSTQNHHSLTETSREDHVELPPTSRTSEPPSQSIT